MNKAIASTFYFFFYHQGILDLNKDGKVDIEDVKYAQQKLIDVLGYNMPAGGGFTAGLLAGLKA